MICDVVSRRSQSMYRVSRRIRTIRGCMFYYNWMCQWCGIAYLWFRDLCIIRLTIV